MRISNIDPRPKVTLGLEEQEWKEAVRKPEPPRTPLAVVSQLVSEYLSGVRSIDSTLALLNREHAKVLEWQLRVQEQEPTRRRRQQLRGVQLVLQAIESLYRAVLHERDDTLSSAVAKIELGQAIIKGFAPRSQAQAA